MEPPVTTNKPRTVPKPLPPTRDEEGRKIKSLPTTPAKAKTQKKNLRNYAKLTPAGKKRRMATDNETRRRRIAAKGSTSTPAQGGSSHDNYMASTVN
jgi:hypothetical protein